MIQRKSRIVLALGGNALQADPQNTGAEAQLKTARETAKPIVDLIEEGHEVILAHGNGPQVGQIVATYEGANHHDQGFSVMPFPECGAMSQGYIGYHLQQAIGEELMKRNINKCIASVVTQVVVDPEDPAFNHPSKPVGSFFNEDEAKRLIEEKGYTMKEDSGRGWRRVVPSPLPIDVIEAPVVKSMVEAGHVVITVGGGGVPVLRKGNQLQGVAAVIDKDFASEKIAELLEADLLIILTAVERAAIYFNTPQQRDLGQVTVKEIKQYIEENHFAPGSMLPKIMAAVRFVESRPGRRALITSLEKAREGLMGKTGTIIVGE
ncbi:carbamate kinase [Alkaliphilus crotonatoxidans]